MKAKTAVVWLVWAVWVVSLIVAILYVVSYPIHLSVRTAYAVAGLSAVIIALVSVPWLRALFGGVRLASPFLYSASGVLAVGAILAVSLGFKWRFIGHGTEAPPASITNVLADGQFDQVLSYARRIPYDAVTHGTADSTLLTDTIRLRDSVKALYTVKAWIAPAQDANLNSEEDLRGSGSGKGRVVARIRVDSVGQLWILRGQGDRPSPSGREKTSIGAGRGTISSDTVGLGYPRLKLPAGLSYMWIDSLNVRDTLRSFRALIIPEQQGGRVIQLPATTHFRYIGGGYTIANYPVARWVFQHSNCSNTPCVTNGCCRTCN